MAEYNNKIVLGDGTVVMDISSDTVTPDKLAKDVTAHDRSGAPIVGTNTYDADTSDATAAQAEILNSKTAYVNGTKLTGSMPNRGGAIGKISTKAQEYSIQQGYHDGSGKVSIDATEQAKLVPANIRQGITVLGVEGTMSGQEDVNAQSKNVTPSYSQQTITPDTSSGYNYLSQVVVAPIAVVKTENAAGGYTVTIG